jgi:hemolysin III
MLQQKIYSQREEKANYLTHAFGALIAAVGSIVLLQRAFDANNGWAVLAYSIYGFGMMTCMASSTAYHYVGSNFTEPLHNIKKELK